MGSSGLEKVNWFKPVRANDLIHCIVTVKSSRKSKSKPFGVTTILIEVFNQKNELVADMTAVWLLKIENTLIENSFIILTEDSSTATQSTQHLHKKMELQSV